MSKAIRKRLQIPLKTPPNGVNDFPNKPICTTQYVESQNLHVRILLDSRYLYSSEAFDLGDVGNSDCKAWSRIALAASA